MLLAVAEEEAAEVVEAVSMAAAVSMVEAAFTAVDTYPHHHIGKECVKILLQVNIAPQHAHAHPLQATPVPIQESAPAPVQARQKHRA
jgi:hypothetical protein